MSFDGRPFGFVPDCVNQFLDSPEFDWADSTVIGNSLCNLAASDGENASCIVCPGCAITRFKVGEVAVLDEVTKSSIGSEAHLANKLAELRQILLGGELSLAVAVEYDFVNRTKTVARGSDKGNAVEGKPSTGDGNVVFRAAESIEKRSVNLRNIGDRWLASSVHGVLDNRLLRLLLFGATG